MRLVLCILLLISIIASDVWAEWNFWAAIPQPFEAPEDKSYVIAVGTMKKLEIVQASDIFVALREGKEIRLRYAVVQGNLSFGGRIKQDAYFVSSIFLGTVNFSGSTFNGQANFLGGVFPRGAIFDTVVFSSKAEFSDAKFMGDAHFVMTEFLDRSMFQMAMFSKEAFFIDTAFSEQAHFLRADFSGDTRFSLCRFEEGSNFLGCKYPENVKVSFHSVGGFSQMFMEWEGNADISETNSETIGRLGLKEHLEYNETFYSALIKNYKDIGWLNQADDAYYTYRREKRKRRSALYSAAEFIFLEIPFGYGVKPLILLRSFLILWLAFGFYYVGFLRRKERWYSPYKCIRFLYRYGLPLVGWGIIHSLDNLTPGIDISSLSTMLLDRGVCVFNSKSRAVIVAESVQKLLGWYLIALFLVMFGKIWVR